jgi:predicted nuclease of predicted toxin-antitoxin system
MKLLFDENLSHELTRLLEDLFPNSIHVRDIGLKTADDPLVWEYAKNNDLILVSKDADMHQRSFMFGPPPKVVWARLVTVQPWMLKDYSVSISMLSQYFSKIAMLHS